MFNLRDFAKVIQGIKLVPATHLRDPNKVNVMFCERLDGNHSLFRIKYKVIDINKKLIKFAYYMLTFQLIRLWCHEVYRVFYDRLISDFDREDFFQLVSELLKSFG